MYWVTTVFLSIQYRGQWSQCKERTLEKRKVSGMDRQDAFGDCHLLRLAHICRVSDSQQAVVLKPVTDTEQVNCPVVWEECKRAGMRARSWAGEVQASTWGSSWIFVHRPVVFVWRKETLGVCSLAFYGINKPCISRALAWPVFMGGVIQDVKYWILRSWLA